MSEEYRPIEVVDIGGTTAPVPGRPPRNRTDVLLLLLVVGVFLGAGCAAFTAWTAYDERQSNRLVQCTYLSAGDRGSRDYDDLDDVEKVIADAYRCDIEGR